MSRSVLGMGLVLFLGIFFVAYVSYRYSFATFVPGLCEGSTGLYGYQIPCAGLLSEALSVFLGLFTAILALSGSRKALFLAVLPG